MATIATSTRLLRAEEALQEAQTAVLEAQRQLHEARKADTYIGGGGKGITKIAELETDGSIVAFDLRMKDGRGRIGTVRYSFVALRAKGKWFTTGTNPAGGYTWEELVAFIEKHQLMSAEVIRVAELPF